jgi:DNA-binding transcriptional LysR family regulator
VPASGRPRRAADELHLAQSAISQQIRRLEAELGIEVFRRTSRSVEVTQEGRLVLAHAHRVLAEMDDFQSQLEELTGLLRGSVRIGGVWPVGPYDLFGVLAEFRAQHPGVAVHMIEDTQEEMLARVRDDELDLAFASVDPDAIGEDFAATLLWEDEFVFVAAVDHPIASRPHVTFELLASEDLITHRDNSALRRRLEATLGRRGLAPRPFRPESITWPVALVWRASRRQPPAVKAFLALALARAEEAVAAQNGRMPTAASLAA